MPKLTQYKNLNTDSKSRLSSRLLVYKYIRQIVAKITLENDTTKSVDTTELIINNNIKTKIA